MLDLYSELDNFNKIDIASLEEQGVPLEEDIRKSIILYNKAIDSIRTKSEDIAIIELKKAISLNPHFYEALNLLGVCYAAANEYEKAKEMFQKVMQNEKNGLKSFEYMQKLFGEQSSKSASQTSAKKNEKRSSVKEISTKSNQNKKTKDNIFSKLDTKSRLVITLSAALILLALSFFAGFATGASSSAASPKQDKQKNGRLTDEVVIEGSTINKDEYDKLKKEYDEMKKQLESSFSEIITLKNTNKLYQAKELANNKNFTEAADILQALGTTNFDEMQEEYDKLTAQVMPKAAEQKFNEGLKLFNQKNFQDALRSFERSAEYSEDFKEADRNLYYIGKSYMELNDSRNALETFKKLIEKYPESRYASYSRARIRELAAEP